MQAMELNSHEDAEGKDGRVLFSILAKFALFLAIGAIELQFSAVTEENEMSRELRLVSKYSCRINTSAEGKFGEDFFVQVWNPSAVCATVLSLSVLCLWRQSSELFYFVTIVPLLLLILLC